MHIFYKKIILFYNVAPGHHPLTSCKPAMSSFNDFCLMVLAKRWLSGEVMTRLGQGGLSADLSNSRGEYVMFAPQCIHGWKD